MIAAPHCKPQGISRSTRPCCVVHKGTKCARRCARASVCSQRQSASTVVIFLTRHSAAARAHSGGHGRHGTVQRGSCLISMPGWCCARQGERNGPDGQNEGRSWPGCACIVAEREAGSQIGRAGEGAESDEGRDGHVCTFRPCTRTTHPYTPSTTYNTRSCHAAVCAGWAVRTRLGRRHCSTNRLFPMGARPPALRC